MFIATLYGISYSTIRVIHAAYQTPFTKSEAIIYILTFTTKLFLDFYVFTIFLFTLLFYMKKRTAVHNHEDFTPKQRTINITIYLLFIMRILGSIYTFAVGILVLNPSVFETVA